MIANIIQSVFLGKMNAQEKESVVSDIKYAFFLNQIICI